MKQLIKFLLVILDAHVYLNGQRVCYDSIEIEWTEPLTAEEVVQISTAWIMSKNFLTSRLTGLVHCGESALTVEPVD